MPKYPPYFRKESKLKEIFSKALRVTIVLCLITVVWAVSQRVAGESLDYKYRWVTTLRDGNGKMSEVFDLTPVGFRGDSVVFCDSIGNKIHYEGDFVACKLEPQLIAKNQFGQFLQRNLPVKACEIMVAGKVRRFHDLKDKQRQLNDKLRLVQQKSLEYENLKNSYDVYLRGNNIPAHPKQYIVNEGRAYSGFHARNKQIEQYRSQLTTKQTQIERLKTEIVQLQNSIAVDDNQELSKGESL